MSRSGTRPGSNPTRTLSSLLKELRPVAYRYNSDSKQTRFGFVAEELEKLLPEVVRQVNNEGKSSKGVVYQDFIALLTAALREHQGRLEVVEEKRFSAPDGDAKDEMQKMSEAMLKLTAKLEQKEEVANKAMLKLTAELEQTKMETKKMMEEMANLKKGEHKIPNKENAKNQAERSDLDRQVQDLRAKMEAIQKRDGEAGTKELEQRLLRQDLATATISQKLLECGCNAK